MINNILSALESGTPALRARYLERIRTVPGPEARQLEHEVASLVQRDRFKAA